MLAFLLTVGSLFTAPVLVQEPVVNVPQQSDDLGKIRQRLLDRMLRGVVPQRVAPLLAAQKSDGSWPDVDYADETRSGWRAYKHLTHLLDLARAYRAPRTRWTGAPRTRAAFLKGLDYWLRHDFRNPNWWWNKIGVPRAMSDLVLMMDQDLSADQRTRGLRIVARAEMGMTGQNLVWVTEVTAIRAILENDARLVHKAYRRIADEIRVSAAEGIQGDFSFHQHGPCLYNHGYGAGFAVDCAHLATVVKGTDMAFSKTTLQTLAGLILDGSQWMARGRVSDFGAEGRELTRPNQDASYLGRAAADMLEAADLRRAEFRDLVARVAGRSAPPLVGNRHFWCSDFMTHQREAYYASARMVSKRIYNTDGPANQEGLKSHHLADGCMVVMRTGHEYAGIFPVWDWQKIPGTTALQLPELTGTPRYKGKRAFVGGVSDGLHGMAAMELANGPLTARKSWFFFDDPMRVARLETEEHGWQPENLIVCLGTAIACADSEHPVMTTLNQCLLHGDVVVSDGKAARVLSSGTHDVDDPAWIWHDQVGYLLLQPASVRVRNAAQSGSWHLINERASKQTITKDVFRATINHRAGPRNESYAYCVLPGVTADTLKPTIQSPVRVIANRANLQAVWHPTLRLAGLAFYQAGTCAVTPSLTLAVDTPCLVLLRICDDGCVVSVANPVNKAADIAVDLRVRAPKSRTGVKSIHQRLHLPGGLDAGKTVTIRCDGDGA